MVKKLYADGAAQSTPQTYGPARRDLRSTAGLAAGLRPVLLRLSRRLRHVRDEIGDLTNSQLSVLGLLERDGDQLIGELAARENMQPPSMTRIIKELERAEHVQRRDIPDDRRQAKISITDSGRAVLVANRKRRNDWLAQRLMQLQPEERDILRRAVPILEQVNRA
jgi:DNA-binding MarR family transcriptional regulator